MNIWQNSTSGGKYELGTLAEEGIDKQSRSSFPARDPDSGDPVVKTPETGEPEPVTFIPDHSEVATVGPDIKLEDTDNGVREILFYEVKEYRKSKLGTKGNAGHQLRYLIAARNRDKPPPKCTFNLIVPKKENISEGFYKLIREAKKVGVTVNVIENPETFDGE